MIKRSFFTLTTPEFKYAHVEDSVKEPESIPVPDNLILLLNETFNSEKQALIKKGDPVKKGEKLCLYKESSEYTTSPVSGLIHDIDIYLDGLGNKSTYIIIKKDKNETEDAAECDLKDDIAYADKYLRTLPGAPPLKSLANDKIHTLVITCTENDLLETTNQYVALKFSDEIKKGAQILKKMTNVSRICIAVPENSKIKTMFDTMQVFETSLKYPSNLPSFVLKNHFHTILLSGQTPENAGFSFISAEAVASLNKACTTKTICFKKHITIIGKQGRKQRVTATIGTSIGKIFKALNIEINNEDRVIIGGPMQGIATYTLNHPVQPDMNTIMIQDKNIIPPVSDHACINCGKCIQICPANIPVNILVRYLEADQYEEAADKYDLEYCIECGLCAYVCTAGIPLYQFIKLGKHELSILKASGIELETANE